MDKITHHRQTKRDAEFYVPPNLLPMDGIRGQRRSLIQQI